MRLEAGFDAGNAGDAGDEGDGDGGGDAAGGGGVGVAPALPASTGTHPAWRIPSTHNSATKSGATSTFWDGTMAPRKSLTASVRDHTMGSPFHRKGAPVAEDEEATPCATPVG